MDTVNISEQVTNLNLTDLIDVETLRLIQDSFSSMAGIASLITDKDGLAITEGSHYSEFCAKYVRATEKGRKRCEACNRISAEKTELPARTTAMRGWWISRCPSWFQATRWGVFSAVRC